MNTLLIHSSGLSGRQWHHLQQALPGPSHAPDLAGYPDGPAWRDGPAWTVDHAYVLSLIDAAEGPIRLVGHSYGGAVAIKAAQERPERIQAIAIHEPVLWGSLLSHGSPELQRVITDFEATNFFDPATGGGPAWMEEFVGFWGGPNAWPAMPKRHQDAFLAVGRKVFREVCDLARDTTPASAFDDLTCPTMFTMGERSPEVEKEVCRILAARHPNRTLYELPGGHMSPVTAPKAFIQRVLSFFAANPI